VSANELSPEGGPVQNWRHGPQPTRNRQSGDNAFWGQPLTKDINHNCVRFAFQNINGIPLQTTGPFKIECIKLVIKDYNLAYLGVQEVNCHEKILPPSLQWKRRFTQINTRAATNAHSHSTRRVLHGGTAHFLSDELNLRQIDNGADTSGLGRWVWTLLRGRQGIQVRVISGYRPVGDNSNCPFTVFSQHELYFNSQQHATYRNPRTAFFEDLDTEMQSWIQRGDQVILGMDANDDIRTGLTETWTSAWGLVNALHRCHPSLSHVATCSKNTSNTPIDGIWCSPGLEVTAGGMTGFSDLYPYSDHRLLWIDISSSSLFGFQAPTPAKRPTNSLPVKDPKAMRRYNNYVKSQFALHRIPEKTFALEQKAQTGDFTLHDAREYDRLLIIQHDIRRRAKKKCRRFYTGAVLFTDELGTIYRRRKLWKMVELKHLGIRTDTRQIRRLAQQLGERNALHLPLNEVKTMLRVAVTDWKTHKKEQVERREAFEQRVDRRRAQRFGTSTAVQTKQRKNSTSTRNVFRRIKQVMKPNERTAISTVEYTDERGDTVECLSREEIEQACVAEGQRRFTQAETTPFFEGSLFRDFGLRGNPIAVRQVLEGSYNPGPDVSPYTRAFLRELRMPDRIRNLPLITGTTDTLSHQHSWQRMPARTGSSPYGPLFCDYIAGAQDSTVADVDASLSSIPYLVGFSPTLWQEATDVMIPKKRTSRHVQKLRIIVLFDAMFNMGNKRIARDMIHRAHSLDLLPDEAYGGVPGRRATTCTLNKILALDLIRVERRTAAICSNDARSCYDRIVHALASICMQRMGVSEEACFVIFGTLQELRHHVRTAFGERARGYGAARIPLHGVGQGNGAGPAIWLVITMPLIEMLRNAGFGLTVFTPLTDEECLLSCFVYVDDADSIHAPFGTGHTATSVAADMQRMLDTWAGGLHATGGMIEASKSYWYLIDFKWNSRKLRWDYKKIADTPATVYLRNPGATPAVLARKEAWEPDPDGTLGTYIAMDGNQNMIVKSLKTKVGIWADKIRTKQLTSHEGWLSFRSGISMSLRHQLSTAAMSIHQCREVTRSLKMAALRATGLPTTMADAVVYAPRKFLGLGLPDLWHLQATLFAEHCLRHGSLHQDPTGRLLRAVLQRMRLEMGVSRCPLEYAFPTWHKVPTPNQFHRFWEYCSTSHLQLRDGLEPLPVARVNDEFLMEVFATSGYSAMELHMLNLCRLHRHIYLLSDLTTGLGTHLDLRLLDSKHPSHQHDRWFWPPAGRPSAQCWRLWKDATIQCFTIDPNSPTLKLRTPLGSWTDPNLRAMAYYSPSLDVLYQFHSPTTGYRGFRRIGRQGATRNPSYRFREFYDTLPADATPTTLNGNINTVRHTGIAPVTPVPSSVSSDDWWGILAYGNLPLQGLIDGIRLGTAIAVTDGSFKDQFGTAAFTFRANMVDQRGLSFVHMTPGMPEEMTPYRAELGGLFGIASLLSRLERTYDLSQGRITVGCDCVAALNRINTDYPPAPHLASFDILWELYILLKNSTVQWRTHWIKGHQDDHAGYDDLDLWGQLNVDMDLLAKTHWARLDTQRPRPFSLPPSPGIWSLWHHNQRITQWTTTVADQLHYNPIARTYWSHKYINFPELDYDAIRMAYRSLPLYYQLRIPKWITQRLPVGDRVVQWGHDNIAVCPRCDASSETHTHVVRCTHPGVQSHLTLWLDSLNLWLQQQHTHPGLRDGVLSILRATFAAQDWDPPFATNPDIRTTFTQQRRLGTDSLVFGWWATGWAETQDAYYKSLGKRTTGKRWLSRLIRKQWEIAWDLWRHRMKVANEPESFTIAREHERLNAAITIEYQRLSGTRLPPLRRWFRRPLPHLLQQNLAFKQDWLHVVRAFQSPAT